MPYPAGTGIGPGGAGGAGGSEDSLKNASPTKRASAIGSVGVVTSELRAAATNITSILVFDAANSHSLANVSLG